MGAIFRHVYLLLIIAMWELEGAYTSTTGGKESSGQSQIKIRFARTSCLWDQGDKSLMCKGLHLKRVPSDFPHNTLTLNLAYNKINILLNTSFEPFPILISLDLKRNELRIIQSAAFQPLIHLESLDLSENRNLVIPSSAPYQPLTDLIILELRECSLADLPNDLLDNFPYLKYLDLSRNRISSLNVSRCKTDRLNHVKLVGNKFRDLTPDTFIFACPTDSFSLSTNPIRYISEDALTALTVDSLTLGGTFAQTAAIFFNLTNGVARSTVTKLILENMELRHGLPVDVFTSLHDHPLNTLVIAASGDLSLVKNSFIGLSCLELRLNNNVINEIEPEYFLGLPRLQNLTLRENQLVRFNPYATAWESNIQYLDLSRNKLVEIYEYHVCGLSNLTVLNLSHNIKLFFLRLIPSCVSERLEILNITGTSLFSLTLSSGISQFYCIDLYQDRAEETFIPGETFKNTILLEIIDVSNSKLNRKSIWDSYFSRSLFQGLHNLYVLHLSNNPLGNLPDRVFEDNSLLSNLKMDHCAISSLAGIVFQRLHFLVYLDLNGNNLLLISTYALKYLPALETLNINDNRIMFIEEGAMENVPLLKNVRMSSNLLIGFNRSTWKTLMQYDLDYIDISGNPLNCQCNYDWLHHLANSSGIFLHQNETLCSVDSLSQFRGKSLLEFDPSSYCGPNIALVYILPFVTLALLIGMLVAFHNRWLIRYKLFLVKLAIIGYIELKDERVHGEFVFDINIMFTKEDEVWAREQLRPTLEERLPDYDRYSFGDEDLTIGMYYLDAVHYAVEHSFKTIMLLSRSAVRDNWFLIKFRTAMDYVHDELTENTVIIFLEDIPENEIPYLVRLYLSDRRPYMRWPEDVRENEHFWKKLLKVVTVNLKYNPLIPPE